MTSLLQAKLEAGRRSAQQQSQQQQQTQRQSLQQTSVVALREACATEIRALHKVFVTWFRGSESVDALQQDLLERLAMEFSHVAPNGHMVQGRAVLLSYLTEKYACYRDRVFEIEVHNVQVLWTNGTSQCLASYEEWQSWEDDPDDDDREEEGGNDGTNTSATAKPTTTKQQFGRLSTCLLEFHTGTAAPEHASSSSSIINNNSRTNSSSSIHRTSTSSSSRSKSKRGGDTAPVASATPPSPLSFRWIHVHETWLENEEPIVRSEHDLIWNAFHSKINNSDNNNVAETPSPMDDNYSIKDDDTAVTGPIPFTAMDKRSVRSSTGPKISNSGHTNNNNTIKNNSSRHSAIPLALQRSSNDDDNDDDDDDEDEYGDNNEEDSEDPTVSTFNGSVAPATSVQQQPTTSTSALLMPPQSRSSSNNAPPTKYKVDAARSKPTPTASSSLAMAPRTSGPDSKNAVKQTTTTTLDPNARRKMSIVVLVDSSAAAAVAPPTTATTTSSTSSAATPQQAQTQVRAILDDPVHSSFMDNGYEWVDTSHPALWHRRDELLSVCPRTADTAWPQFFVTNSANSKDNTATLMNSRSNDVAYWGSWFDFEASFQAGRLKKDFQLPHAPSISSSKTGTKLALVDETVARPIVMAAAKTTNIDDDDDEEDDDDDDDDDPEESNQDPENDDDDDGDGDGDGDDDEEEDDKPHIPLSKEERQFMENSQGILFFEEEDETPAKPLSASMTANNSSKNAMTLDSLLEDEEEEEGDGFISQTGQKSLHRSQADMLNSSQAMLSLHSAADASHKRHVAKNLDHYAVPLEWEGALVGVSIAGFDIGTSQGPIADADWYETKTEELTAIAQFRGAPGREVTRRKLVLPEMVFPIAHVALEGHGIWLSWDASDCLAEWAKCHAGIAVRSNAENKGVSVLKSKDAALWDAQRKSQGFVADDASSVYHYDWTYSTPLSVKTDGGEWVEMDESGMRMDLLTDKSVSILFFDEIVLYEDDLHDNGQVQISIKLRIMPTCAYILSRLFVRVDQVIVRVRETRILVDFFGIQPQVYRDICWRECAWEELESHGLPRTVAAWTSESSGEGSEALEWHNLIQQLPEVDLPDGMTKHAVLEYGVSLVSLGESGKMAL